MQNLMLCEQAVRVDDDGFVSLTDMWKASGGKKKNRPGYFLENEKTIAFLEALNDKGGILEAGNPASRIVKGGKHQGTWAHKLVAYKYASWIDPVFEVGAYTVLDKFFSGDLISKDGWKALHDYVIDERFSKAMGSFHGKGLSKRRRELTELQKEHLKLIDEFQLQLHLGEFL